MASPVSFTIFGYNAREFRPNTCMKRWEQSINFNLSTHTLPPSGFHSSTRPASWGLTSMSTPAWADCSGSVSLSSFAVKNYNAYLMRCQQHPGNTVWLPRPVRALFLLSEVFPFFNHQFVARMSFTRGFAV